MNRRPAAVIAWTVLAIAVAAVVAVGYEQFFTPRADSGRDVGTAAAAAGGAQPIEHATTRTSAPELHFVDGVGRPRSLADFRGRVVLLNIWATWCVPCRQEMPALDRLQSMLGGPGFEVVALSIDHDGLPKVKKFYADLGLKSLGIYVDTGGDVTLKLRMVGVPLTLLVDRDGSEAWRKVGPAEWDQPAMVELVRKQIGAAAK